MGKINIRQVFRIGVSLLLLGVAIFLIFIAAAGLPVADFTTYWAAGRLNITGQNPYDSDQVLELIRTVGWVPSGYLMLFNPPMTLAFIMPFGALAYLPARTIWLILTLVVFIGCAAWAWEVYGGKPSRRWISIILIVLFGPFAQLIKTGQITWLIALGIAGFVFFIQRKDYFWAGVSVSLVLIKPQLLYLVPFVILLWSLEQRQWSILAGMLAAVLVQMAMGLLPNPDVLQQYVDFLRFSPPSNWQTASLGTVLRFIFGPDKFWLQFLPTVFGLVGAFLFWFRQRKQWDWVCFAPLLCIASIATSSYNWVHDVPVAFLALIQAAVIAMNNKSLLYKLSLGLIYLLFCLSTMLVSLPQHYFWWIGLFLFGLFGFITFPMPNKTAAIGLSHEQSIIQE